VTERACWNDVLETTPDETLRIRRAAFRELLSSGRPVPIQQAATDVDLEPDRARHAAGLVASVGMAEVADDHIVGMDGLTTRQTTHRLLVNDVALWTWCAYDIVGISAALRADATGTTACGYCGETIKVVIRDGQPDESSAVGWMPTARCSNVITEFCPSALLFCSQIHLDAWRKTRPDQAGQALDIEALAELGRLNWAPLVDADAA
jgi:Alkylmercury lyase